METVVSSREADVQTLVAVTPSQLRELANLLELSCQRTSGTQVVLVPFTDKILLHYDPRGDSFAKKLLQRAHQATLGQDIPIPLNP